MLQVYRTLVVEKVPSNNCQQADMILNKMGFVVIIAVQAVPALYSEAPAEHLQSFKSCCSFWDKGTMKSLRSSHLTTKEHVLQCAASGSTCTTNFGYQKKLL